MVALEKLIDNKYVVAYQVEGLEKRDVKAIKEAGGLNALKQIIGSDAASIKPSEAGKDYLGDLVGKTLKVTVYLEKDGVTAEDIYTINVVEA